MTKSPAVKADPILDITIQSTRGSREFSFSRQTNVGAVIEDAVRVFGFVPGDRFELVRASKPGEPLEINRPLVSYGVEDGDVLILTAIGSGVSGGC